MLFLGHQSKKEAYRIILKSLKDDPDYHIFCVDDSPKHIEAFKGISMEEGMRERTFGIVSPIVRTYTEEELEEYFSRVMGAVGSQPMRVRDPSDDMRGFLVLPDGSTQFREQMNVLVDKNHGEGATAELRNAFVKTYGEVGRGHFKSEEKLNQAMNNFIMDIVCP